MVLNLLMVCVCLVIFLNQAKQNKKQKPGAVLILTYFVLIIDKTWNIYKVNGIFSSEVFFSK